jgi:STE24 endopeptidase
MNFSIRTPLQHPVTASLFTVVFVLALAASVGVRLWLARRPIAFVGAHRDAVPAAFAERVGISAHRKAADYTVAKQRLAMLHTLADALLLLAMTLGGGLAAIIRWTETIAVGPLWRDVLMFAVAGVIFGIVNLPFSWWHTFRIEERFGFNGWRCGWPISPRVWRSRWFWACPCSC